MSAETSGTDWLDGAAVGASALCVMHCLALPVLLAVLPTLSTRPSFWDGAHIWLLAAAIPTALVALLRGRSVHRCSGPLLVGLCGLALMTLGALIFDGTSAEVRLTVAGSSVLAAAHVANWRRRHGCRC